MSELAQEYKSHHHFLELQSCLKAGRMSRFYANADINSKETTKIIKLDDQLPKLTVNVIDTGNQVIDNEQLDAFFHNYRVKLKDYLLEQRHQWSLKAEWFEAFKRKQAKYLHESILNDSKEAEKHLLPGCLMGLGSYFVGRIVTNKQNWSNHRLFGGPKGSIAGRLMTNFPMRVALPLGFGLWTLNQYIPNTMSNITLALRRDVMPPHVVARWDKYYEHYYNQGLSKYQRETVERVDASLQSFVRAMRLNFIKMIYEDPKSRS